MRLHIFKNLRMYMAPDGGTTPVVNGTASSGLSDELKTFYDKVLLIRALPALVHGQFGQERPIPRNGGKKIEFRRFSSLPVATTPLTEGVAPAGESLTETKVEATVAQYGDFIKGTDILDLTAIDPIMVESSQLLGEQAGQTLDIICRDIMNAGSNVQYARGGTTAAPVIPISRPQVQGTCVLTVDEIRRAKRTLSKLNCKPLGDGCYVAVVDPDSTFDLQSDDKWIEANKYGQPGQTLYNGELGKIYGVRFVESTFAKVFAGGGCGTSQVETATVVGTVGAAGAGNATVVITAAGLDGSPKTYPVAVANDDTAALVAGKIIAALQADPILTALFTVGGTGATVTLTAKTYPGNDGTLNISINNGTCTGLTAALASANTTAGVAGIDVHSTLFIGANATGRVTINGQTLQTIFKELGSAGTADPLDQSWSHGWKALVTWKILNDAFLLRIEHAVSA